MHDKDGSVIDALSMPREAFDNAEGLQGGNIVVPQSKIASLNINTNMYGAWLLQASFFLLLPNVNSRLLDSYISFIYSCNC